MREAIGLRALLRSTEFLGIFVEETAGDFFSMRVARQLSCDPRNQGIYAYIYTHIYKGSMNPKTCFLEENVDEISVIVILSSGWYPYS